MNQKQSIKELEINGEVYIRKSDATTQSPHSADGLEAVILRTQSAGVHYGYLKSRNGGEAELINSRRLWYWKGANCLSQLATDGVREPASCKFSVTMPTITLLGVIEVLPVSGAAARIIEAVPVWRA